MSEQLKMLLWMIFAYLLPTRPEFNVLFKQGMYSAACVTLNVNLLFTILWAVRLPKSSLPIEVGLQVSTLALVDETKQIRLAM